jgi:hypothetical protein
MSRIAVLAALVLAVFVAPLSATIDGSPLRAQEASASSTGLSLTADARYVVDPANHRVRVGVTLAVTNHRSNTKTHLYYYDRVFLAVQPGTTNFKIASAGAHPAVRVVRKAKTYTLLRIDFGKRLAAGATRRLVLVFDIPDKGGAATRTTRIGTSLVSFGVWGFGATGDPGGGVTVVFPAGYAVDVDTAGLQPPTTDPQGNTVYTTGPLANPLSFFAYFVADRPSAYVESTIQVPIDDVTVPVTIRAWPDDPAWAGRVGAVLRKGLPALAKDIGLPWTVQQPLIVSEAISRTTQGFSGRYDPPAGQIEIAYYASPLVILHEAAHAWFNGSLLADRWANEGFASYYALRAATAIGEKRVTAPKLTPALEAVRMPLNAWPAPGGANAIVEDAEYAASFQLATLVAERATPDGLRTVWQAIHEGRAAYQPIGARGSLETSTDPPDWRGLLDVLEERTPATYDDLWRAWVIRAGESQLLDERETVRQDYATLLDRADPWLLPRVVRDALRVWQYDQANELMAAATGALDDRDAVFDAAAGAGLVVPSTMEVSFEGTRGFAVTSNEAAAELAAIAAFRDAASTKPTSPAILDQIGLWGSDPSAAMGAAAAAFTAGDLEATVQNAGFAKRIWTGAAEVGRNRVVAVGASTAALLLGLWLVVRWYRDRSVRRRAVVVRQS